MSTQTELATMATELSARAAELADFARRAAEATAPVAQVVEPFLLMLTIFLMACFVGYYVVWSVTPALHSPLMGVTNAISSVIVVGGILAAAAAESDAARLFGVLAVTLASVNIVGGFLVTRRMLSMFQKKKG
jgi:H+-translocating NAD(P) transhydrogenase subunit alpha